MARSRKFLTVGALGVASFALIGAGATATFNDNVTAEQTIAAGRMNMTIAGVDGWSTPGGKTLTLPTTSPVGSKFSTGRQSVTVTNNGTVESRLATLLVSAPGNNSALRDGLRVRIFGVNGSSTSPPDFDGTLNDLQSDANKGITALDLKLAPGKSVSASVEIYADDLPDSAQGGYVTPTFTVGFKG
jgi:predicted ribosomally synthesized peptide with SipW-like signal peptide